MFGIVVTTEGAKMVWAIVWTALGCVAVFWTDIFLIRFRLKQYSESELTELSEVHVGINRRMTVWTLGAGALSVLVLLLGVYLVRNDSSPREMVYPVFAGSIALGHLVFPVFFKVWGVYPVPKSYRYLVGPAEAVGLLSTSQVVVVMLVTAIAVVGVYWPS